jgi:hypothetical protein
MFPKAKMQRWRIKGNETATGLQFPYLVIFVIGAIMNKQFTAYAKPVSLLVPEFKNNGIFVTVVCINP